MVNIIFKTTQGPKGKYEFSTASVLVWAEVRARQNEGGSILTVGGSRGEAQHPHKAHLSSLLSLDSCTVIFCFLFFPAQVTKFIFVALQARYEGGDLSQGLRDRRFLLGSSLLALLYAFNTQVWKKNRLTPLRIFFSFPLNFGDKHGLSTVRYVPSILLPCANSWASSP
jgi:hypothetical protein